MAEPKVLVLDEPSLGLAPRLVSEIFGALAQLKSEHGLAIVLVEQNARAAFRVADAVVVMDRGRVVATGTPQTLATDDRVQSAYLGGGYDERPDEKGVNKEKGEQLMRKPFASSADLEEKSRPSRCSPTACTR